LATPEDGAHGIEEAVGRVNAVEIFGDFAERNPRVTGIRVAAELGGAPGFVNSDEDPAGVRAVMRADSMNDAGHG